MAFRVGKPEYKQLFQTHHRRPYPVIVMEADALDPDFKKSPGQKPRKLL